MAIKVVVGIRDVTFDGVTMTIPTVMRVAGQSDNVGHDFAGLAANIANAAAIVPYLKSQIVTYVQNQYGVAVIDTEIAIFGSPQ
jgi:hypothetical protein